MNVIHDGVNLQNHILVLILKIRPRFECPEFPHVVFILLDSRSVYCYILAAVDTEFTRKHSVSLLIRFSIGVFCSLLNLFG